MAEWIPVEERVPEEKFRNVLITFEHEKYGAQEPVIVSTIGMGFWTGHKWSQTYSPFQSSKHMKVLAWMPLPEKYEVR